MGFDFHPYIDEDVFPKVRESWLDLIPDKARAPFFKQGWVAIDFSISKHGGIGDMSWSRSSDDPDLDHAAWDAIKTSSPLAPIPPQFGGQSLRLRINFIYNPDFKPPAVIHFEAAKYKGKGKQGGTVLLSLVVNREGKPTGIQVIHGLGPDLDKQAVKALRKWKFQPATANGVVVSAEINEEILFK